MNLRSRRRYRAWMTGLRQNSGAHHSLRGGLCARFQERGDAGRYDLAASGTGVPSIRR